MSTLHRRLSYREGPEEEPKTGFFQRGRELESVYDNHKYTDDEREVLKDYESLDYLPPHSTAYKASRLVLLHLCCLLRFMYSIG